MKNINFNNSQNPNKQVITFGCRLNAYESEIIKNHLNLLKDTNTIVINTCAVTSEAERQARQKIRKLRKDNPKAQLIITGCSAQINPETYAKMSEVDQVLGNIEKLEMNNFRMKKKQNKVKIQNIMKIKKTKLNLISSFKNSPRAFIQIQNGCNHRCTFCTIPFGRGNSRSVPIEELIKQIQKLISQGCKEIVFTGVDITEYGKDLSDQPHLGVMTRHVLNVFKNLPRLRLSSLDPIEIDDHLFQLIETEPRLMPHFHLSLQSGDNLILKRMKRRHLSRNVIELCNHIHNLRKEIIFGADVIVGFPTETEEMFKNTLEIIKKCKITYLHVFPYSIRKGTFAAKMPQVIKSTIKTRSRKINQLATQQLKYLFDIKIGKEVYVLIEKNNFGYCEHYTKVRFDISKTIKHGKIVKGLTLFYNIMEKELIAIPIINKVVKL